MNIFYNIVDINGLQILLDDLERIVEWIQKS